MTKGSQLNKKQSKISVLKPLMDIPSSVCKNLLGILTDVDDTLTTKGKLLPCAFQALAQAKEQGLEVIVVTGRPAGWVDHMARMWPVDGVIGENGAFYFYMKNGKIKKRFLQSQKVRNENMKKLNQIAKEIIKNVPGSALASDQPYRECDLAIDYCEDVRPLSKNNIQKICRILDQRGATYKISSIHINAWFGNYDKLKMTKKFLKEVKNFDPGEIKNHLAFFGDSPNDEPLFAFFTHAIGVANIKKFLSDLTFPPPWLTTLPSSKGFSEGIKIILEKRRN